MIKEWDVEKKLLKLTETLRCLSRKIMVEILVKV